MVVFLALKCNKTQFPKKTKTGCIVLCSLFTPCTLCRSVWGDTSVERTS